MKPNKHFQPLKFNKYILISFAAAALFIQSCGNHQSKDSSRELPILGRKDTIITLIDGKQTEEFKTHPIPAFKFTNQYNQLVTNADFAGKIYVADFFFTSCPTICPVMKSQMIRVYEKFKTNPNVKILSHTIDPMHDSVAVLREFANRLDITGDTWQFVTADQDSIYDIAWEYMVSAMEDKNAPGGFIHSGSFILVDKNGFIRAYYDGTNAEDTDLLMQDIENLLHEN